MKKFYSILAALLLLSLTGCDIYIGSESAVKSITGIQLFTNYADDGMSDARNPQDDAAYEKFKAILRSLPYQLDEKLYTMLNDNPHISDIRTLVRSDYKAFNDRAEAGSETMNLYMTTFKVDEVYTVKLFFLVPGIKSLPFLTLSKPARRLKIEIYKDKQIFANSYCSPAELTDFSMLVSIFSKDHDELPKRLNARWEKVKPQPVEQSGNDIPANDGLDLEPGKAPPGNNEPVNSGVNGRVAPEMSSAAQAK